jgi:hypothetical protein
LKWASDFHLQVIARATQMPAAFAQELVMTERVPVRCAFEVVTRLLVSQVRRDVIALMTLTSHLLQCKIVPFKNYLVFDQQMRARDPCCYISGDLAASLSDRFACPLSPVLARPDIERFPASPGTAFWTRVFATATDNGRMCISYIDARLILSAVCDAPLQGDARIENHDVYILTVVAMNFIISDVSIEQLMDFGLYMPRLMKSLCFV